MVMARVCERERCVLVGGRGRQRAIVRCRRCCASLAHCVVPSSPASPASLNWAGFEVTLELKKSLCLAGWWVGVPSIRISKQVPGIPISRQVQGIPISRQVSGIPISRQVPGIPISKQVQGIPISRQVSGIPISKQVPGIPISRQVPGTPISRQVSGIPISRQVQGIPISRQVQGIPISRQVQGIPISKQVPGIPISKRGGAPISRGERPVVGRLFVASLAATSASVPAVPHSRHLSISPSRLLRPQTLRIPCSHTCEHHCWIRWAAKSIVPQRPRVRRRSSRSSRCSTHVRRYRDLDLDAGAHHIHTRVCDSG